MANNFSALAGLAGKKIGDGDGNRDTIVNLFVMFSPLAFTNSSWARPCVEVFVPLLPVTFCVASGRAERRLFA